MSAPPREPRPTTSPLALLRAILEYNRFIAELKAMRIRTTHGERQSAWRHYLKEAEKADTPPGPPTPPPSAR